MNVCWREGSRVSNRGKDEEDEGLGGGANGSAVDAISVGACVAADDLQSSTAGVAYSCSSEVSNRKL